MSLDWAISLFSSYRDAVAKPTLFLVDLSTGAGTFARHAKPRPAHALQRVVNSAIIVCDPAGNDPIEAGEDGLLRLFVTRMYQV